MNVLILLSMIFLHIVDDYYLQGILASMKQKDWWKENAPDPLYKHDYVVALIEHAFSWTFMIMLPVGISTVFHDKSIILIVIMFLINWIIHAVVDHLKANVKVINLVTDQIIHILQIVVTWGCFIWNYMC